MSFGAPRPVRSIGGLEMTVATVRDMTVARLDAGRAMADTKTLLHNADQERLNVFDGTGALQPTCDVTVRRCPARHRDRRRPSDLHALSRTSEHRSHCRVLRRGAQERSTDRSGHHGSCSLTNAVTSTPLTTTRSMNVSISTSTSHGDE